MDALPSLFLLLSNALDRQHDAYIDCNRHTEEVLDVSRRLAKIVAERNPVVDEPEHLLAAVIMRNQQYKLVSREAINLRGLFSDAAVRILRLKEEFEAHTGEMFAVAHADDEDAYAKPGTFVDFGVIAGDSRWMRPWELRKEKGSQTVRLRSSDFHPTGGSMHVVNSAPELSLFSGEGDVARNDFFLRRRIAVGDVAVKKLLAEALTPYGVAEEEPQRQFQIIQSILEGDGLR